MKHRPGADSVPRHRAAQLLDDLARPEAYPVPQPTTVNLVTTHISWVFITDREVWKLKRPVDYGFVNYTDLERRRHFCHEEVRVNRRLAPDVYLGIVPVRLHRGVHSFTSKGTIVDYAVRMRRLSDSASAESLLQHAALTHERLATFSVRLANLYSLSASEPSWGSLDVLRGTSRRTSIRFAHSSAVSWSRRRSIGRGKVSPVFPRRSRRRQTRIRMPSHVEPTTRCFAVPRSFWSQGEGSFWTPHVTVDTTLPVATQVRTILDALAR